MKYGMISTFTKHSIDFILWKYGMISTFTKFGGTLKKMFHEFVKGDNILLLLNFLNFYFKKKYFSKTFLIKCLQNPIMIYFKLLKNKLIS